MPAITSFHLQYSSVVPADVIGAGLDLLITEGGSAPNADPAPHPVTNAALSDPDLNTIQTAGTRVLGYVNAAVTDAARGYWNNAWTTAPAGTAQGARDNPEYALAPGAPDWLRYDRDGAGPQEAVRVNNEFGIVVDFTDTDWRDIVTAQATYLVGTKGYDGIFFDDVGRYFDLIPWVAEGDPGRAQYLVDIGNLARAMMELINHVAAAVEAEKPGATIVVNGDPYIIANASGGTTPDPSASFLSSIDAMLLESLSGMDGTRPYDINALNQAATRIQSPTTDILTLEFGGTPTQRYFYKEGAIARDFVPAMSGTSAYNSSVPPVQGPTAYDDILIGTSANDMMDGLGGNDILNGRSGADTMVGGLGNDTFIVDNPGDTVVEAAGGGYDTIRTAVGYTLAANVERGELLGDGAINLVGNGLDNVLVGNSESNILLGGTGNDILNGRGGGDQMRGGAGNDNYVVDSSTDGVKEDPGNGIDLVRTIVSYTLAANVENGIILGSADLFLVGNDLDNTLVGNSGNNAINGKGGADRMFGYDGDDSYDVDNVADTVVEAADGGTDLIRSTVSYALPNHVENGLLYGFGDLFLVGNDFDNLLSGNSGANVLNGRNGDDRMVGKRGNDVYIVDSAGDVVIEDSIFGGIDEVRSAVSRNLDLNVERMMLLGTSDINAGGNALNNVIIGNSGFNTINASAGNDTIKGGGGLDTLTGGLGSDTFVFSAASESGPANRQRDRITDFNSAENDRIYLAAIDANTGIGGNQAFILDTNGSFSAGEIRQTQFGSNLLLEMNTDADAAAEMSILLLNSGPLDAGDFVL